MIRFIGKEPPDKYKDKVIKEYKTFVEKNLPNKLNSLDIDDKKSADYQTLIIYDLILFHFTKVILILHQMLDLALQKWPHSIGKSSNKIKSLHFTILYN